VPPKTELEILLEVPLGEADLEPVGVDVDAKREETDALAFRDGKVDIEDVNDWASVLILALGSLTVGAPGDSGGSKGGESFCGGVMKPSYCINDRLRYFRRSAAVKMRICCA
jgi:hypothetical protein